MNQATFVRPLFYLWLALTAAIGRPAEAQAPYRVRHYTIREGLAQGGAYYMVKDSRRYVWFMSQKGLTRFDGTRFVNYYSSKTDVGSGPTGETGSGLVEAPNGDLWFGTEQCLNRYVRATGRFTTVFARDKGKKPLPTLTHVFGADANRIWFINEAEGIVSLDWRTGRRTLHTTAFRNNSSYDNEHIKLNPSTNEVWILLANNGVVAFNYRTHRTRSFCSRRADNLAGSRCSFSALYLAPNNTAWLTDTNEDALVALDLATGRLQKYPMPTSLGAGVVSAIEADRQDNLWLATGGDGIYQFSTKQRRWVGHLRHDPFDPNSIATNAISELMIDAEGVAWVNADPTGLDQLTPDAYRVRHYDVNPIRSPSLGSHNVWKLDEDSQSNIWIGLYMGGIDVFDSRTERVVHHYERTGQPGSLPDNTIYAFHIDSRGRIWVGAGDTFCRFDPSTDAFVPVRPRRSSSFSGDQRVVAITELPDGRFILATWGGLYRFDPVTNRMDLLTDGGVRFSRTLHYDRRTNRLYAGRRLRDFVCYELMGDSLVVRYTALPTLSIQNITPDADPDRIWVTTNDGLFLLRAADGKVVRSWRESDGLPNPVVYSALADRSGLRWLSTNRGIAVLNPRTGLIRQAQSIEATEFNNSAYLLTRSGEMYFGSTTGLYRFNPLQQIPRPYNLSVDLTSLLINDRANQLDSNLTELHQLLLQPDQRTLTLQFGTVDYFSGGKNQYRYRLTGYDHSWVESGPVSTARYTNLPPGEYVFEVLAADAEGRWMKHPRRLAVNVLPPFWQTVWFEVLLLLLAGGLTYVSFRAYLRGRLRRQRREFQLQMASQQTERERLARDLHDHIGPDLVALKLQLEVARDETTESAVDHTLQRVIDQTDRIVADVRQVSHALMPTELRQQGLISSLAEYIRRVNHVAEGPEINFTHELDSQLPESVQQILLSVTKELVNNALRHARATVIDIELYHEDKSLALTVSDNGQGYDPTQINYQSDGIGLRNIRTVVEGLHGHITVSAKPAGGMVHQVIIPGYAG